MARTGSVFLLACLGGALIALSTAASAQQAMGNQPWNFTPQNRAGIAALIQQQQNGNNNTGSAAAFACGGGGTATATANYTCIILNDSYASINAGQTSAGSQTATSDAETQVNGASQETLSTLIEELQAE
jgi:hypothetical protein